VTITHPLSRVKAVAWATPEASAASYTISGDSNTLIRVSYTISHTISTHDEGWGERWHCVINSLRARNGLIIQIGVRSARVGLGFSECWAKIGIGAGHRMAVEFIECYPRNRMKTHDFTPRRIVTSPSRPPGTDPSRVLLARAPPCHASALVGVKIFFQIFTRNIGQTNDLNDIPFLVDRQCGTDRVQNGTNRYLPEIPRSHQNLIFRW
jgi:hypothetical protein